MAHIDDILKRLTEATGIGYVGDVKDVVYELLEKDGIDAEVTTDGSVCGYIKGKTKDGLMIACHIDEVGFLINNIDDAGRLGMSEIGGIDVAILPGQEVVVHGLESVPGYIASKPPHLVPKEERKKITTIDKLFIDTGLPVDEAKKIFKIGDSISFISKYQKLQGDLRTVKSLDNRASVACGILAMRELSQRKPELNIYFVATSQEEFTGLGARTSAYRLPVEYAIVIDVSFGEHPDLKEHEYTPLGSGPVIGRGATIPEKLSDLLIETAKENDIPYRIEPLPTRTGTDADGIAFSRAGIATCVIMIPLRYMHTPVEVVCLKDIEYTKDLVVKYSDKLLKN